jgi:DNA invertase Pin-like site-specific DNA recombinase
MKTFIAYYRVSTAKQGQSGLGLEAQRATVMEYAEQRNGAVVEEFTDVMSGRSESRPELLKAVARAKMLGCTLVVAKLDRLARNARFLSELVDGGADVVFCNLPDLPPGAVGRFMVQVMASIAELESGMISDRTKAALAAAKARGTKIGGYRGDNRPPGLEQMGHAAMQAKANKRAQDVMERLQAYQANGPLSRQEMARMLNQDGVPTPGGSKVWTACQVTRVINRCHDIEAKKVEEAKKRAAEMMAYSGIGYRRGGREINRQMVRVRSQAGAPA